VDLSSSSYPKRKKPNIREIVGNSFTKKIVTDEKAHKKGARAGESRWTYPPVVI